MDSVEQRLEKPNLAQIVAPLEHLLKLYRQPPGLFVSVKSYLPPDAEVVRGDVSVATNELYAVIGTHSPEYFWRVAVGHAPPEIPFFPADVFQHVGSLSDEALAALFGNPGVREELIQLYFRLGEIVENLPGEPEEEENEDRRNVAFVCDLAQKRSAPPPSQPTPYFDVVTQVTPPAPRGRKKGG